MPVLTRLVSSALALALAALALRLGWLSRDWPLIHDAPLMHYVAWLIQRGAVPYRDVFDMNAPGVYLVHLGVMRALGAGSVAWRLFDLGWLAATVLLLAWYARPFGAVPAAVAGLLFAVYHLAGGPWLAGQRDFLLCPLLLAGLALVASAAGPAPLAAAGLAVGAAGTLKPPALLFLPMLAGAAAIIAGRRGRSWWRAGLAVLAGGAVVPLGCLAWLAWTGGLAAFADTVGGYVIPLYSRLGRVPPWSALGWWPFGWQIWTLFGLLVAGACAVRSWDTRRALAVAGVAGGLAHFLVQGKGWEYQLYPLALFGCLAAGLALASPSGAVRGGVALALALLIAVLGVKGFQESRPAWIAAKAARVRAIVADLDGRLRPDDTVQVLDTTDGGIHALFLLGVREPTRFIYDFHFFHDENRPFIQALRREFLAGLAARRPAFVLVLERGWPVGGYERLARFPDLAAWLRAGYRLDRGGDGYRIYAKRRGT
jgi:hypothetical protein